MSYIFIPEIGQKEPVWLEDEIPEDAVKSWPSLGMTGLTHSIETKQKLFTAWAPYVWPIKTLMLIGILLMLLQAFSSLFKNIANVNNRKI